MTPRACVKMSAHVPRWPHLNYNHVNSAFVLAKRSLPYVAGQLVLVGDKDWRGCIMTSVEFISLLLDGMFVELAFLRGVLCLMSF